MNPMNLLQLKPYWSRFKANHPKLVSFVKTASDERFLDEGSLIEITDTNSQGKKMSANLRVRQDDMDFLGGLKDMLES